MKKDLPNIRISYIAVNGDIDSVPREAFREAAILSLTEDVPVEVTFDHTPYMFSPHDLLKEALERYNGRSNP